MEWSTHTDKFYTWILPLTLCIFMEILQICKGEIISACFSNKKSLNIDCGTGSMVRITKAFYGYSDHSLCQFVPGDCTQEERENYACVGSSRCSINLPSGQYGQHIKSCNRTSNYFHVEYICVPVEETKDICTFPTLTGQSGYISTPKYPMNYGNNQNCQAQIRVNSSQMINLTIVDMDLEVNGSGCSDLMYARDKFRSVTLCDRRFNERLTTIHNQNITIKFHSNARVGKKGFWIHYEAYPPLPGPTTERETTTPATIKTTSGTDHNTTIPVIRNSPEINIGKQPKLPFAAIVGGVIGTLTLILTILLVLLACKWWKERRTPQYKKKKNRESGEFLDARNPAFRSSNDFQGVEIYYNC